MLLSELWETKHKYGDCYLHSNAGYIGPECWTPCGLCMSKMFLFVVNAPSYQTDRCSHDHFELVYLESLRRSCISSSLLTSQL